MELQDQHTGKTKHAELNKAKAHTNKTKALLGSKLSDKQDAHTVFI